MRLKNRMVMSPMTTACCNEDQTPSERLLRYFEERARWSGLDYHGVDHC